MSVAVGDKVMLPEYGGSKIELEDKVRITWRGLVYKPSLPKKKIHMFHSYRERIYLKSLEKLLEAQKTWRKRII